jgi:DNA-binding NarL/FixJ family response regulator
VPRAEQLVVGQPGGEPPGGAGAAALRVAVADDQALVRAGFCGIIGATPGFAVVGEASNGAEAVEVATRAHPDVVLMDVRMPVMDGIEATRRITGAPRPAGATAPRVLILTTFDLDEYVFSALRAGASGFLLKSTQPSDLLTAIRVVAEGDSLLAPSVTRRLVAEFVRNRPAPQAGAAGPPACPGDAAAGGAGPGEVLAAITAREREVLTLIATGLSNHEIAQRLSITPATAKTHVGHLLTKLSARDRVHLVIIAYQAGLVSVA